MSCGLYDFSFVSPLCFAEDFGKIDNSVETDVIAVMKDLHRFCGLMAFFTDRQRIEIDRFVLNKSLCFVDCSKVFQLIPDCIQIEILKIIHD